MNSYSADENKIIPGLALRRPTRGYESGVFQQRQLPLAHISPLACCRPMTVSPAAVQHVSHTSHK